MKLLHAVPADNGTMTFYLPQGQFGAIGIEYDVDAAAAVTLTKLNMGNIRVNWNGDDIINVEAELINNLNNIYGGVGEFSAVAGAAHRMMAFLPLGQWFDSNNVWDIGENDRVMIKVDFPDLALAANVDSGFVRIFGKNRLGIMNYLHKIIPRPVVASGAATLADSYLLNNVSQVYINDPAALLSNIQIIKDGETIVDGEPDTLLAYNAYIHQLESTVNVLAIDMVESMDIREALGVSIHYNYIFTGAGTLQQYFSYIDFTPEKSNESQIRAHNKIVNTLNLLRPTDPLSLHPKIFAGLLGSPLPPVRIPNVKRTSADLKKVQV